MQGELGIAAMGSAGEELKQEDTFVVKTWRANIILECFLYSKYFRVDLYRNA